jgi:hypothetical protein
MGKSRNIQKRIGIEDGGVIKGYVLGPCGRGSGRNNHEIGGNFLRIVQSAHAYTMRIKKGGGTADNLDAVSVELFEKYVDLNIDDLMGAQTQILCRYVLFNRIVGTVKGSLFETGQMQDRFPHGFAGNSPRVYANAAYHLPFFYNSNPFAELRGLNGGVMPRRTATQYYKVEVTCHVASR